MKFSRNKREEIPCRNNQQHKDGISGSGSLAVMQKNI